MKGDPNSQNIRTCTFVKGHRRPGTLLDAPGWTLCNIHLALTDKMVDFTG